MAKELTIPIPKSPDYDENRDSSRNKWLNVFSIIVLMIACSVLYYLDIILDFMEVASPGWYSVFAARELYLLVFSVPLICAAYMFRLKGILITAAIILALFASRAALSAPYLEPFYGAATFLLFAAVLSGLVASVLNRKDEAMAAYAMARDSEERFQTLFDNMSEGVVLTDAEGKVLKANPAIKQIMGFKRSQMEELTYDLPKLDTIRADGSLLPADQMPSSRAMKTRRPVMGEVAGFKRPNGKIAWFISNAIPLFGDKHKLIGVVTTFVDITERKETERQLLIAETAIKTCVSAIATADLNGNLTYVNPVFLKIWGYDNPDEVLDKNIATLCKEEGEVQEVMKKLLAGSSSESAELVARKKSGAEFIVGLRASLIVDAEGKPVGLTASMADITDRVNVKGEQKS